MNQPYAERRSVDEQNRAKRSGLILVLILLGASLLVLAPLSLTYLRGEAVARSASATMDLEVEVTSGRFTPSELHVPTGATVHLTLINHDPGGQPHDLQTTGQHEDSHLTAWPGERQVSTFTAADRPGRYPFFCTLRGHSAAGETGVIVVG